MSAGKLSLAISGPQATFTAAEPLLALFGARVTYGSMFTRYKSPALVNLDFTPTFTNPLLLKDFDGLEAS